MSAGDPVHERGMEVRREGLGDEHVDAAVERTTRSRRLPGPQRASVGRDLDAAGLDRKTRSCITLTAPHGACSRELALHVGAALRNGLTEEEIKEVLLHGAIYCGVPAANAAFAVAQRVLDDHDDR